MSVKTIEEQSILDFPALDLLYDRMFGDTVVSLDLIGRSFQRLLAGEETYAGAWTKKDLRREALEEIEDLANYLIMGMTRRILAKDIDPTMETQYGAIAELVSTLYFLVSGLEDFDEER